MAKRPLIIHYVDIKRRVVKPEVDACEAAVTTSELGHNRVVVGPPR
jgi:hypothetical protein